MVIEIGLYPKLETSSNDIERRRLEGKYQGFIREELTLANKVSYVGNKNVPVLRLYRYKEAFAFSLVTDFLKRFRLSSADYVFDPFAGMGTTLFGAWLNGIPSIGIDRLPIATFISRAICRLPLISPGSLYSIWQETSQVVDKAEPSEVAMDVPIMSIAFPQEQLLRLRQWKSAIDSIEGPEKDILLLLFFSILEDTSYTSKDGQFLRFIPDKKLANPDKLLYERVVSAEQDLQRLRWQVSNLDHICTDNIFPQIYDGDTRNLVDAHFKRLPTAIITSPPYVNRYDYTRSYSLELCFHFVRNFAELRAIRRGILRSHIESKTQSYEKPPHPAVKEAVEAIASKPMNNPRIPYMITAYFIDMQKAISEWSRILAKGAAVALVVDNVRFEGELIPVDLVLSDMAEEHGFTVNEIIVARYKGNSSQQMGKYGRVPVRESIVMWRKN